MLCSHFEYDLVAVKIYCTFPTEFNWFLNNLGQLVSIFIYIVNIIRQ